MAKVRAIKSFVSNLNGRIRAYNPGDEFEQPAGARWVEAGLCEWVDPPQPKTKTSTRQKATSAKTEARDTR